MTYSNPRHYARDVPKNNSKQFIFHPGVGKGLAEAGGTVGKRLPKFDLEKADVLARLAFPSAHLKLRKSALAGGGLFCYIKDVRAIYGNTRPLSDKKRVLLI